MARVAKKSKVATKRSSKTPAKSAPRPSKHAAAAKPAPAKPAPASHRAKPSPSTTKSGAAPVSSPPPADARRHVLSLSFLRDGDEFMARLETDSGQITEMKNRSLDQLLTLVAGELEDLLQ